MFCFWKIVFLFFDFLVFKFVCRLGLGIVVCWVVEMNVVCVFFFISFLIIGFFRFGIFLLIIIVLGWLLRNLCDLWLFKFLCWLFCVKLKEFVFLMVLLVFLIVGGVGWIIGGRIYFFFCLFFIVILIVLFVNIFGKLFNWLLG